MINVLNIQQTPVPGGNGIVMTYGLAQFNATDTSGTIPFENQRIVGGVTCSPQQTPNAGEVVQADIAGQLVGNSIANTTGTISITRIGTATSGLLFGFCYFGY